MKPRMPKPTPIVGVDLGQAQDYSAITIIEHTYVPVGAMHASEEWVGSKREDVARQPVALEYHLRHLERPALGTPYPEVVERIVDLVKALGDDLLLAVDYTGVGAPVTDYLRGRLADRLKGTEQKVTFVPVTITGGDSVTKNPRGGYRVPKRDLVAAALVLLQNGTLKIAEALTLRETLVKELLAFRVKINISTSHDSYEAWREGDHDDLVLATAMACWAGERLLKTQSSIVLPGYLLGYELNTL